MDDGPPSSIHVGLRNATRGTRNALNESCVGGRTQRGIACMIPTGCLLLMVALLLYFAGNC